MPPKSHSLIEPTVSIGAPHHAPDSLDAKPRWERRKDARPQELLAAALDQFVEKGYAATRLEDVASKAGVSKGTLYLYFSNKEELFKAVIFEHITPTIDEATHAIDQFTGHSRDLLQIIMRDWWNKFGSTHLSGLCKLVMTESANFPEIARFYYEEVIERANQLLRDMIERGVKRGEIRAVDIEQCTHIISAPMVMLTMWHHTFGPCIQQSIDVDRYLNQYLDLMLHGLLISPPSSPSHE